VTDEERLDVQEFDKNGNFITKWGTEGSGNVYVVDIGNNRIQKSDNNGNIISMWGSKGSGAGQFDRP
jgi:DNA-binding beta-propeller fold protein YncE